MGFWFDILHSEKKTTRHPIEDEEGKQIGEYEDDELKIMGMPIHEVKGLEVPFMTNGSQTVRFVPETETTWNPDTKTLGRKFPKFTIDISKEEEEEGRKIMDPLIKIVSKKIKEFPTESIDLVWDSEAEKSLRKCQAKSIIEPFYIIDDEDGDGDEEMKSLSQWENILVWMSWYPERLWKNSDFMKEPYFIGYEAPNRICDLVRLGYVEKGEREGRFQTYRITKEGIKQVTEIFKNNHKKYHGGN